MVKPNCKTKDNAFDKNFVKKYDKCISIETNEKFSKFPILSRNFAIANTSGFIVFCVKPKGRSGAKKILDYAIGQGKTYVNLFE